MNNLRLGQRVLKWFLRIFLIICGILVAFPVLFLFMSSFKNSAEFMADPMALPKVWRFGNYVTAFIGMDISKYIVNSLLLVVGTALLYGIMLSTTSYIIAKYQFKFRGLMWGLFFFGMMVPAVLRMTSMYYMFEDLNMTNNLFTLMLIYSANALPAGIMLIVSFVKQINNAFFEAAKLDGATELQVFTNVVLPMVKPILSFQILVNMIGTWNEFTTAMTFISDPKKYPVSIGLHFMEASSSDRGVTFAGLAIAMIPVLIVYGLFQKQIQEGVSADAGVKG